MNIHPNAGKKIDPLDLINVDQVVDAYYANKPDITIDEEKVSFGTSGHRGNSFSNSYNEDHILAICQSICDYRKSMKISGPLFLGKDTHALSHPAEKTAIEVFIANEVITMIDENYGFTPTPVISHSIIQYNRNRNSDLADGVVITPSHNPPIDGGIKYNSFHGGPADTSATDWIANNANLLLSKNNQDVKKINFSDALKSPFIVRFDYKSSYVNDLNNIIDFDVIRSANLKICADVMGGSGLSYWNEINKKYELNIDINNDRYDPTFSFMRYDHDGKIRMDCSSPHAMAGLINLKDEYDIAFGNDPDFDRHGIVTKYCGLLNPNHFLAVAIDYLYKNRPLWSDNLSIGKTLVSSSIIDRISKKINRPLMEVPVGFKWFVNGLYNGNYGFGGEESAGASFLRKDGSVWSTDKDGIILALLASEICAKTGKDPGEYYHELTDLHGTPYYARIDAPASLEQKNKIMQLSPQDIKATILAEEKIIDIQTHAPANNKPIGGIKVTTLNGWFAARPSGTEDLYKIYAESFISLNHLKKIQEEAKAIIANAIN